MEFRILLGLVLCNLVWSANPIMGKILLEEVPGIQVSWLRSASAAAAFLVVFGFRKGLFRPQSPSEWGWSLSLGFFSFAFAPALALVGLATSRATDNSLIIALEPLVTVLMARLFLGDRMSWLHAVAFPCALYGFALLSGLTGERLRGAWDPHLFGNLLMLVSLLGEAIYSVFARKLLVRREAIPIFGNAVVFGAIVLTCILIATVGLPNLFALTPRAWAALLWMGPIGTTGTYLYWMKVLPRASIPSMALTLFLQPVAGSLWGYLGLGERLAGPQVGGAALILLAVAAPLMERRVRSP